MTKNINFLKSEDTTVHTTKVNTWKCGRVVHRYQGEYPDVYQFSVSVTRENDELHKPIQMVNMEVNGTGPYGGDRKPIDFYLGSDTISELIEMLTDIRSNMETN